MLRAIARKAPPLDLATLPQRSLAELRVLWRAHLGRAKPPSQRRLLIRELAWRVQAREHGGLDAHTQRLLKQAMRDGLRDLATRRSASRELDFLTERGSEPALADATRPYPDPSPPQRRVKVQPCPDLPAGTRLVRIWNDRRHEVIMHDGGRCTYQGTMFGSLSEVAREITGTRWSGPRFFGVTTRAKPRDMQSSTGIDARKRSTRTSNGTPTSRASKDTMPKRGST